MLFELLFLGMRLLGSISVEMYVDYGRVSWAFGGPTC